MDEPEDPEAELAETAEFCVAPDPDEAPALETAALADAGAAAAAAATGAAEPDADPSDDEPEEVEVLAEAPEDAL